MSGIGTRDKQNSNAVDSPALNDSCTERGRRLPSPDAATVENFTSALIRRTALPAGAGLCDDHLFDLMAQLPWPDSTQEKAQSVNGATPLPLSAASDKMCLAATPKLPSDPELPRAQIMHSQHLPVQSRSTDTALQSEFELLADRNIGRKAKGFDADRVPDAPPAVPHFTPHPPAAVEVTAAQVAYPNPARSELRMQEFNQLVSQIGAQVAIDSFRSEVAVSLSHAMFSSTRLKIRGDKDSIEVNYECGSAEEMDWFGSNAEALAQRMSASLQRRVTVRPVADQSAT